MEFDRDCCREEAEFIEGEVVEIQIDRPATGTVRLFRSITTVFHISLLGCENR